MRRFLKMTLLMAVFAALLCGGALAAEAGVSGFYDVGVENSEVKIPQGVTITPQTAAQGTVESVEADLNGVAMTNYYPNSARLSISCSGSTIDEGEFVVMLVSGSALPTASNQIYYINQDTVDVDDKSLTFDVYPILPTATTQMTLFVTNDAGLNTLQIPVSYAVPYMRGDTDVDRDVDAYDVTTLLRHVAKIEYMTKEAALLAGDVTEPVGIDANDVTKLLRFVAKIDSVL